MDILWPPTTTNSFISSVFLFSNSLYYHLLQCYVYSRLANYSKKWPDIKAFKACRRLIDHLHFCGCFSSRTAPFSRVTREVIMNLPKGSSKKVHLSTLSATHHNFTFSTNSLCRGARLSCRLASEDRRMLVILPFYTFLPVG